MGMNQIEEILSDIRPGEHKEKESETTLSIWVTRKDKARYQKLQKATNRQLSKKLREVFRAVLDHVERGA